MSLRRPRILVNAAVAALASLALPQGATRAGATPSTTVWAPATPALQGFGVLHLTYDTYFGTAGLYPVDVQTGKNSLGAVGAGVSIYFTPAVALLTGPNFFLEPDLQPGQADWMWSAQLDVDLDFTSQKAETP
jgi:hypothetical protein